MATPNKKKLAALNKENCEEHPRSHLVQNSNVPRSQGDYVTQVFGEIEGRVTKRLSQEFSRTENCILGALARLDDFPMNSLLQGHSGTTPETSQNVFSINQGTNEDDSQSDPHPEAGLLTSGRENRHDMAIGIQRERKRERVHMVRTTAHRLNTFWTGNRLVPSRFLISTNWFLILTNAFRNGFQLACSTACRSAGECNETSDYGTVSCLAKMTQHSSSANWNEDQVTSPD